MFQRLFQTDGSWTQLLLRVTLALVMFPHGAQKLFGWFGGYGFSGTMGFMTEGVGLPAAVALLVILIESLGSIALAFGLFSRGASLGILSVMIGAVLTTHVQHGFFMNWAGAQGGEGFEYHLLAVAIAAAVVIRGPGRWALDSVVGRYLAKVDESSGANATLEHA